MKKFLVILLGLVLALSLFAFSGCKKKAPTETAPGTQPAPTAPGTTNAPGGETAPGGGAGGGGGR